MELNYYALCISILCDCLPETAFKKLQADDPSLVKDGFRVLNDDDLKDMIAMKRQGLTYRQIAEFYGVDNALLHKKIKPLLQVSI